YWKHGAVLLFTAALMLLTLVLIPGVGTEVNGSTRWLNLGIMTIQASELAKLFIVVFMAWLLSEKREWICHSWKGFLSPLILVAIPAALLLKEPDLGAVVVLMIAVFGMMFLAGVNLMKFILVTVLAAGSAIALIVSSDYRQQRLQSFIQALSDPFHEDVVYGTGYQLAQALIAFGRGEWFGVGLGNSIQKMYFLPEAHTDFVFAIIAEELGFVAVVLLMTLFLVFIARAMIIARRNEKCGQWFAAYFAYGITFLFAAQVVINVAVNTGLIPTKGLTLPFLSYGGSSLIVCLVMVAILIRIDIENYFMANRKQQVKP
ncbi:MAG: putative lipid II flippase FtsW, partial [Pseudohongiellaceae bacterium]